MCIYMSVCRCKLVILAHVKKLTVIKVLIILITEQLTTVVGGQTGRYKHIDRQRLLRLTDL
jgi:hypothetical protein